SSPPPPDDPSSGPYFHRLMPPKQLNQLLDANGIIKGLDRVIQANHDFLSSCRGEMFISFFSASFTKIDADAFDALQ
ncbi:MAG: hypothetical protein ACYC26_17580, partial [Phycisphaerales bacterium]